MNWVVKNAVGWGFGLWLVGYILGIILFMLVPPMMVGWVIMPVGVGLTLWVLWKKIEAKTFGQYLLLAVVWTMMAVVLDYFFLVKMFKPADGYYKPDVYLYYILTFGLPVLVGKYKHRLG